MKEQVTDPKNKKPAVAPTTSETISHRSPNYPSISLPDAIKRVEKVHVAAHNNSVDKELLSKLIGYSSGHGNALKAISALKKYGLLEDTGKGLKVSDAAVSILVDPKNSAERSSAINKAVYSPALFSDLISEFGLKLPADEVMRAFLIRRSFNRQAAEIAISNFRESVDFMLSECGEPASSATSTLKESALSQDPIAEKETTTPKQTQESLKVGFSGETNFVTENGDVLIYRLSKDCSVKISFSGPVTSKNIEKLVAMLELNKDAYEVE